MKASYQESFNNLTSNLSKAKAEGKSLLAKEHCSFLVQPPISSRRHFREDDVKEPAWQVDFEAAAKPKFKVESINESIIPEYFLSLANPTFLVRHPTLVFKPQYRARISVEGKEKAKSPLPLEMTMRR